jgi:hypothetical protein
MKHQLYFQLSNGYMHKAEFLYKKGLGFPTYFWKPVPDDLIKKHGRPIARFIVNIK